MENTNTNENIILFWGGGYGCFSNFSAFMVDYDGMTWMTTEHAYQAAKFNNIDSKKKIQSLKSAQESFKLGQGSEDMVIREDWHDVKLGIMEDIIRAKIAQHPYVERKLRESGDKEIVEASPVDSFWGWGPDQKGENHLGKIWMKLREELK